MVFDCPTVPTPSKLPPPPTRPSIAHTVKAAADPGYTRLHITPFDSELLSVVVPASARPSARNVSFHSLQTFPEKRYGFVDLPTEAAEKLRRKLNGAVLKGVKLRIEPARQSSQEAEAADASASMGKSERTSDEQQRKEEERAARKEKKRADKARGKKSHIQTEREEVVGVQLEAGRQVKRGWTEPESTAELSNKKTNWSKDKNKKDKKEKDKSMKKRAEKSEYTDKPECLFKTVLPANKLATPSVPTPKEGEEEVDSRAARRARKEAKKAREVVVHEFANWTRIPTFLKSGGGGGTNAGSPNLEYVDGKGWVDEATGDVVQPLKSTRPVAVKAVITKEAQLAKRAKLDEVAAVRARAWKGDEASESESTGSGSGSDTSSSGGNSSEEDDDDDDDDKDEVEEQREEEDEVSDSKDEPVPSAEDTALLSPTRPRSSGSAKNLMIKIPPPPMFATPSTPGPKKEVHPLEALYKRAKPGADAAKQAATPSAEKDKEQPFSFFGGMNNDDIEEEEGDAMDVVTVENSNSKPNENENEDAGPQPPMTPFGRAEFEWRNVRSAAPTPDTAHPSRMTSIFKWPTPGGASDDEDEDDAADDDDDDNVDEKVDGDKDKKEKAAGEGDFQSWFWDNRGDLNRSWKRRRKTAAKDKRYRENKARAERAI